MRAGAPLPLLFLVLVATTARAEPDFAERALERGIAEFRKGEYARALVDLSVAARGRAADPAAHLYLGYTQFKLGRHDDAIVSLRRALARDPALDGPLPRFYLGLALYRRRLYLSAREELLRVVSVSGESRLASRARAFARAARDVVLAAAPDLHGAYHDEGLVALAADRPAAAVAVLEEALRWADRLAAPATRDDARRETLLFLSAALSLSGRAADAAVRIAAEPARTTSLRLRLALAIPAFTLGRSTEARALLTPFAGASIRPDLRALVEGLLGTLAVAPRR